MNSTNVSPIKVKPLRTAGQSLDEKLNVLIADRTLLHGMIIAVAIVVAGAEWLRWFTNAPPSPKLFTVVAAGVIAYSSVAVARLRREVRALRLGREGERAVAELLDSLRAKGYLIFHDVPGRGFNLDHVIIAPQGLFVVETKTHSKRPDSKVFFDGTRVLLDGKAPDRNPLDQARAAARWLCEALLESTGRKFPVRAVVVYPGWWVESSQGANSGDIWVLNPKGVGSFIGNEPTLLPPEDVRLAADRVAIMSRQGE
ncbi:MAG: nuclease-related domain-containing protein [Candidatus Methylomirabilota bacterium]|jgi:hypothetical protein